MFFLLFLKLKKKQTTWYIHSIVLIPEYSSFNEDIKTEICQWRIMYAIENFIAVTYLHGNGDSKHDSKLNRMNDHTWFDRLLPKNVIVHWMCMFACCCPFFFFYAPNSLILLVSSGFYYSFQIRTISLLHVCKLQ